MRLLFDQGTPVPLRKDLPNHKVETAYERGWSNLKNGDLLTQAEAEGFDAIITTDRNLRYQQKSDRPDDQCSCLANYQLAADQESRRPGC